MTLAPALKSPQLVGRGTWEELDADEDCPTTEAQALPARATEAVPSFTVASALCSLMATHRVQKGTMAGPLSTPCEPKISATS